MNLDKILLGRFWTSSTVGEYYLVQTLAFSLLLIGRAVRVVLIQGFAEDIKSGSMKKIEEQSRKVAKFLILLFLPLVLFAFAFSGPYLGLVFGSSYEETGQLLAIIIAGVGFSLLADPLTSFITASGDTIRILISNMIGFAVSLALLIALVPESIGSLKLAGLAGVGAGAAFTISAFVQIVYYRLRTKNIHSYFPLKTVSTIIVANAVALAVSLLASRVLDSSHLSDLSLVLVPILFFGISFIGVLFMGALSREDIQYLRRAISTKTMIEYVKSELRE
jgi:O-antigen/teichoic acid export membrane protein